jgi:hypothetical protein
MRAKLAMLRRGLRTSSGRAGTAGRLRQRRWRRQPNDSGRVFYQLTDGGRAASPDGIVARPRCCPPNFAQTRRCRLEVKAAHHAEEFYEDRGARTSILAGRNLRDRIRESRLISRRSRQNPLQTGRAIRFQHNLRRAPLCRTGGLSTSCES